MTALTHDEIESLVNETFRPLAYKEYGLKATDFVIRMDEKADYEWAIIRGKPAILILGRSPFHPRFRANALSALAHTKPYVDCWAVESVATIQRNQMRIRGVPIKDLIPERLTDDRLSIRVVTTVIVRDRISGLEEKVVVDHGSTFTMIEKARLDLSRRVHAQGLVMPKPHVDWSAADQEEIPV